MKFLEMAHITKKFSGVTVLKDVHLDIEAGEVHALMGENGAGKSTLMKILAGIYACDEGEIRINGETVVIHDTIAARNQGINFIHQEICLAENMSIAENLYIGMEIKKGLFLDKKKMVEITQEHLNALGLDLDANTQVSTLSIAQKQMVEIARALFFDAKLVVMDEPTSSLTNKEVDSLFEQVELLKQKQVAIVYISHRMEEIFKIADRVTVLHKGKSVATVNTAETDEYALTSLMVGHAVDLNIQRAEASVGSELLDVHALNVFRADGSQALKDVSFTLNAGEILAVAGVAGSGQKELCESIAGLHPIAGGSILMENKRIDGLTPREIINRGVSMSFIPEDRLGMGLAGGLSLYDNLLLKTYRDQKGVFLRRRQAKDEAVQMVKELEISTPSISTQVRKLSGGNVQKVLLGRELNANPRVLITAYPVRGLDINSSMTIYHLLNEQKKKGVGVLFIGEDLDVLLSLCDRILVLCNGRVSAIVNSKYATKELLGLKMTGAWEHDDEEDDYA